MHFQTNGHTSRSKRHSAARSEVSAVLDALLRGEPKKVIPSRGLFLLHSETRSSLREGATCHS